MATLTPGVLQKLVQSINSPDAPTGDHRSTVLQVSGIVTASLSSDNCGGFYLQLSDSVHSAYVSPPPGSSAESFRLGQLVHVDRLLPSHPVPLASSLALSSPSDPNSADKQFRNTQTTPSPAPAPTKRRFSLPAQKTTATSASRQASPAVPSKCAVPGLVQAREENRRAAREPAIVVPSRYLQPSPVAVKRGSASPAARRLSRGASPATGEKRRTVGISMGKSWEDPGSGNSGGTSGGVKEKPAGSGSKVDRQGILRTQVAISQRLSDAGREPNSIEDSSTNVKQKPVNKIEPHSMSEKLNPIGPKVPVHDHKWTDGSIPFDAVSDNLEKLGKEAFQRRNVASIAAAEALEEALAVESLIRSLSMFSDLCSSSKAGNPLPTIDGFLSIYNDVMKWSAITESLVASRSTNGPNEATLTDWTKPASLWVEAALITDLEILSLVDADDFSLQKPLDKPSILSVDPPRVSFPRKNSLGVGTPAKSQVKAPNNVWTRGYELGETLNFAKSLREEMKSWFLKFLEVALDVGFRLFSGSLEGDKDNGRVATVLSHLKRVNDWLDGVGKNPKKPEEDMKVVVEKIERVKRKIYGFVITRVGSAFD